MKQIIFNAFAALFLGTIASSTAQALVIEDAVYDRSTQTLELSLFHTGGLKRHTFSLSWDQCQVVDDVKQIAARLLDTGWNDTGTDEIRQKITLSLSGMTCRPAMLTIFSGKFGGASLWID